MKSDFAVRTRVIAFFCLMAGALLLTRLYLVQIVHGEEF
ncbi:MAG: hypothetical protein Greene041679_135, partial [Parcubacteria group bacterium Greene0416_79]